MTRVKDKKTVSNSAQASQEVQKKPVVPVTKQPIAADVKLPQKRKLPAAIQKQTEATKRQKIDSGKKSPASPKKTASPQKATAPPSQSASQSNKVVQQVQVVAPVMPATPKIEFDQSKVDHLIINKERKKSNDPNIKWFGLEHKGVTFFPRYEPHGKPLLYKGEPIEIGPEIEEVCNQWVQVEGSDFAEKENVKKNFISMYMGMFAKDQQIENFDDFDFRHIREHVERTREQRNARTTEEKRQEKDAATALEAKYRYALFNGTLEKTGNSGMEAPGIFRGRGEHPHAGKLKTRIVPGFVTINLAQDAPIPICDVPGHAWKSVIEKRDGTWLASFRDERSTFLMGKYVQLAADSSIKGTSDMQKYEKARRLKNSIGRIRENYHKQMNMNDRLDNQIGVCTYLIDKLALRVGNEKGEDEADTVGCCSLRCEHIRFEGDNNITLDFLGKDSIRFLNTVQVEPIVYRLLENFAVAKQPSDDIFELVNASKLNEHLKNSMEDLSAKVFRTYNASFTLQDELAKGGIDPDKDTVDAKVKFYEDCNRKVATLCNHQKAVPKNFEETMSKARKAIEEKCEKLKKLEDLLKSLKAGKELKGYLKTLSAEKGAPKNVESCKTHISKLKERVQKDELAMQTRKDNSSVALGTSRINYMDPRITISWCKLKDVPIEKIFQANLQAKFNWAMSSEPEYQF